MTGTDDLRTWLGLVQWALTGAIAIYAWFVNRQAANADEVNKLTVRVATLEEQMRHLPDADQINELAGDMKAVQAELRGIRDSIAPLQRGIERMNQFLLEKKG